MKRQGLSLIELCFTLAILGVLSTLGTRWIWNKFFPKVKQSLPVMAPTELAYSLRKFEKYPEVIKDNVTFLETLPRLKDRFPEEAYVSLKDKIVLHLNHAQKINWYLFGHCFVAYATRQNLCSALIGGGVLAGFYQPGEITPYEFNYLKREDRVTRIDMASKKTYSPYHWFDGQQDRIVFLSSALGTRQPMTEQDHHVWVENEDWTHQVSPEHCLVSMGQGVGIRSKVNCLSGTVVEKTGREEIIHKVGYLFFNDYYESPHLHFTIDQRPLVPLHRLTGKTDVQ